MKSVLDRYGQWLTMIIRLHAYAAATLLMAYMVGAIIFSSVDFVQSFQRIVNPIGAEDSKNQIRYELLHSLAFIIVLYKAYSIIISYARNLHVNIKFIIEIAIIGSIVELIFNYKYLSEFLIISYTSVFVLASIIYLYFYEKLNQASDGH